MEELKNIITEQKAQQPSKAEYLEKIGKLSAEDQAFMDGYLFAKLTEAAKKSA